MPNPSIFTSVINSYLPEPHASLLNGIIFGINLKTSKAFYEQLKIVELLHLVVLSGINITLLGGVISSLTIKISRLISCLITVLIIVIFIIFVGAQAPIVRAGFMGILTLAAIIFGRKSFALYSLILSGFFIYLLWPKWITTVSFQLSFGATLGIILFARNEKIKPGGKLKKILYAFWGEFKLSLAAQVFTTPIIFIYFKQISLISPLANILVSPVVTPLMIFGFVTAFLGKCILY